MGGAPIPDWYHWFSTMAISDITLCFQQSWEWTGGFPERKSSSNAFLSASMAIGRVPDVDPPCLVALEPWPASPRPHLEKNRDACPPLIVDRLLLELVSPFLMCYFYLWRGNLFWSWYPPLLVFLFTGKPTGEPPIWGSPILEREPQMWVFLNTQVPIGFSLPPCEKEALFGDIRISHNNGTPRGKSPCRPPKKRNTRLKSTLRSLSKTCPMVPLDK